MTPAIIVQLIAQVGIPAAQEIIRLATSQRERNAAEDVAAKEWLDLLPKLKSYNDLRNELVKTPA